MNIKVRATGKDPASSSYLYKNNKKAISEVLHPKNALSAIT